MWTGEHLSRSPGTLLHGCNSADQRQAQGAHMAPRGGPGSSVGTVLWSQPLSLRSGVGLSALTPSERLKAQRQAPCRCHGRVSIRRAGSVPVTLRAMRPAPVRAVGEAGRGGRSDPTPTPPPFVADPVQPATPLPTPPQDQATVTTRQKCGPGRERINCRTDPRSRSDTNSASV